MEQGRPVSPPIQHWILILTGHLIRFKNCIFFWPLWNRWDLRHECRWNRADPSYLQYGSGLSHPHGHPMVRKLPFLLIDTCTGDLRYERGRYRADPSNNGNTWFNAQPGPLTARKLLFFADHGNIRFMWWMLTVRADRSHNWFRMGLWSCLGTDRENYHPLSNSLNR